MSNKIFYTIGIAFATGIFIRSLYTIDSPTIIFVLLVAGACVVGWRLKAHTSVSTRFESPLFLTALTLFFLALGIFRLNYTESIPSILAPYEGKDITLTGRIATEPDVREKNIQLTVLITDSVQGRGERVLVTINPYAYESLDLSYGDTIQVEGIVTRPEPFTSNEGRVFNYPSFLKARGIRYIVPFGKVVMKRQESGTLLGYLFRGKEAFQKTIEMHIGEPYAGLGEGVLLGVKRALGKDLEDTFRKTGIIHIVVLSGYNIMLVVECVLFILSFVFFPKIRMVVGLVAITLFAILVGLSATVIRASLMAGLLLIARTTGKNYLVLRALTVTGIFMLIWNPYLLAFDPGFQLSFLATLGLILVTPLFESFLTSIPTIYNIRSFVSATLGTQIFVLPLLLYQMGTLSLVAVFVNVLILPMVSIAMLLTFLTGVVGFFSHILGYIVGYSAYLSLGYIIVIAQLFGALPFASLSVHAFPFWIVIVTYIIYTYVLVHIHTQTTLNNASNNTIIPTQDTHNDYKDWTIIDDSYEIKSPPEALRASGGVKSPLPFR